MKSARAWLLTVGCIGVLATPLSAATRVTIQDLKEFPERYDGQTVSLECYYDKESPIWVRALPDADEWIGFFVTGRPEKSLSWSGEYYNLFFAPYSMREAVRTLRGGDKITVIGETFRYHSVSFDGAGIHVQQILLGWGSSAKALAGGASGPVPPLAAATPPAEQRKEVMGPTQPLAEASEKYAVTINGKRYEGLRLGDQYNFDGIEFQVDQAH